MKDIEAEAFKDFCKTAKVRTIQQYEQSLSTLGKTEAKGDLFQERIDLEHEIAKCQADIKFITSQEDAHEKNLEVIKNSVAEEQTKLQSLQRGSSNDK